MNGLAVVYELAGLTPGQPAFRAAIAAAADALRRGLLVAFPTETVYGLGASAFDGDAIARVFAAKGRPADNPLIVHVDSAETAKSLAAEWPDAAESLARAFWPGPLTLIVRHNGRLPRAVTVGLPTVALRVPNQRIALELLRQVGPLAAPSANLSGRPSPTRAEHVMADLGEWVAVILDDGPCPVGVESTVLDVTVRPPALLRPGGVTPEMLEKVVGKVEIAPEARAEGDISALAARSPGTRYRHYAPRRPLHLLELPGDGAAAWRSLQRYLVTLKETEAPVLPARIALLAVSEAWSALPASLRDELIGFDLGPLSEPQAVAARLYQALHDLDRDPVAVIVAHTLPERGVGLAVNNRLRRAATRIVACDAHDTRDPGREGGARR